MLLDPSNPSQGAHLVLCIALVIISMLHFNATPRVNHDYNDSEALSASYLNVLLFFGLTLFSQVERD